MKSRTRSSGGPYQGQSSFILDIYQLVKRLVFVGFLFGHEQQHKRSSLLRLGSRSPFHVHWSRNFCDLKARIPHIYHPVNTPLEHLTSSRFCTTAKERAALVPLLFPKSSSSYNILLHAHSLPFHSILLDNVDPHNRLESGRRAIFSSCAPNNQTHRPDYHRRCHPMGERLRKI